MSKHSEELQLLTYSHLEMESCVRQSGYQGTSDAASKSSAWQSKVMALQVFVSLPETSAACYVMETHQGALLGVPYSRHVIALLQERLFTMVLAHLSIAQKCQHPFTQQSYHSRRSQGPKPALLQ